MYAFCGSGNRGLSRWALHGVGDVCVNTGVKVKLMPRKIKKLRVKLASVGHRGAKPWRKGGRVREKGGKAGSGGGRKEPHRRQKKHTDRYRDSRGGGGGKEMGRGAGNCKIGAGTLLIKSWGIGAHQIKSGIQAGVGGRKFNG